MSCAFARLSEYCIWEQCVATFLCILAYLHIPLHFHPAHALQTGYMQDFDPELIIAPVVAKSIELARWTFVFTGDCKVSVYFLNWVWSGFINLSWPFSLVYLPPEDILGWYICFYPALPFWLIVVLSFCNVLFILGPCNVLHCGFSIVLRSAVSFIVYIMVSQLLFYSYLLIVCPLGPISAVPPSLLLLCGMSSGDKE